MVGSSILPVAYYKNQLYFLFGKENSMEDSHRGYSDFGGGIEDGENIIETAIREGSEETTGFLGDKFQLKKMIKKNGGTYQINHNEQYFVNIFCMEYHEYLPYYYNQNHHFLWKKMDKELLNKTKLFEKIEINWFTPEQMKLHRNKFRKFYREIVDKMLLELPKIKKFIISKNKLLITKRNNKNTRKNKSYHNKTKRYTKK
jgi:hypothetical protein